MPFIALVYAFLNVGLGYLVVKNTEKLWKAILYYIIGSILIRFVLSKGPARDLESDIPLWIGSILVAYLFYKKFGVKGAAASLFGPFILGVAGLLLLVLAIVAVNSTPRAPRQ